MPRLRLSGKRLHASRDYESERADLLKGRNTALEFYQDQAESIAVDESLSADERRAGLIACKSEIERTEREYQEALQDLNDEEAASLADEYGVSEDEAIDMISADEYCDFDEGEEAETYEEAVWSSGVEASEEEAQYEGYE